MWLVDVTITVDRPSRLRRSRCHYQAARDQSSREALEDRGYRVIAIRFDQSLDEQVARHPDVFGRA